MLIVFICLSVLGSLFFHPYVPHSSHASSPSASLFHIQNVHKSLHACWNRRKKKSHRAQRRRFRKLSRILACFLMNFGVKGGGGKNIISGTDLHMTSLMLRHEMNFLLQFRLKIITARSLCPPQKADVISKPLPARLIQCSSLNRQSFQILLSFKAFSPIRFYHSYELRNPER